MCTVSLRRLAPLLVVLAVPAARADESFPRYLNAAVRMYENLEYERALEQALNARKHAGTPDEEATASLHEGIFLFDLNRVDEAKAAFKEGLLLQPEAKLPLKVSPRVQAEFEALRVQVRKELAPLLAKQEAERQAAEVAAKAKEQAREAEAQRQAEADARAKEQARLEAARQQAEIDARKAELARLDEERRRAADLRAKEEQARLEAQRRAQASQTVVRVDTPVEPRLQPPPPPPALLEEAPRPPLAVRGAPVLPLVLVGLGLAAVGGGVAMGMQAQAQLDSAKAAPFQDDANRLLGEARGTASMANLLYGSGGALGLGALIAGIVWAATPAAPPAPSSGSSTP